MSRRVYLSSQHKLVRKVDRVAKKTERWFDRIFYKKKKKKIKGYHWEGPKYNPFVPEDTAGFFSYKIKIGILCISTIVLVYLTIFSGFFDITNISITGTDRIDAIEMYEVVKNTLDYKNIGIIPNSSFFMANVRDVSEVLKTRFPIQDIRVEKRFPNDMNIQIVEKLSTVIYDNGSLYGIVGIDGRIIELSRAVLEYEWKNIWGTTVTTTEEGVEERVPVIIGRTHTPDISKLTEEIGEYPIVYDKRDRIMEKDVEVLHKNEVVLIITWFQELQNTKFGSSLFEIQNNMDMSIHTQEGWIIKTRLTRNNVEEQLRELQLVLDKNEEETLSYIDIRYKNRIYWK